jgi:hypothetical protein
LLEKTVGRIRLALLLAAGLQMLPEPDKLGVRILWDMAKDQLDPHENEHPIHQDPALRTPLPNPAVPKSRFL